MVLELYSSTSTVLEYSNTGPAGINIPTLCIAGKRTNHYAIRASISKCQSAVFKLNQCEKRNPVQQRFDVRNQDSAVDTTNF